MLEHNFQDVQPIATQKSGGGSSTYLCVLDANVLAVRLGDMHVPSLQHSVERLGKHLRLGYRRTVRDGPLIVLDSLPAHHTAPTVFDLFLDTLGARSQLGGLALRGGAEHVVPHGIFGVEVGGENLFCLAPGEKEKLEEKLEEKETLLH